MAQKQAKKKISPLKVLVVMVGLAIGVGLMAYPYIANFAFEHQKNSIIDIYEKETEVLDTTAVDEEFARAAKYNENIFSSHIQLTDPFQADNVILSEDEYMSLLNPDGNGLMCYLNIPAISVSLPVYHTTASDILERGVGHLEGTSLPVGGENTHCVLTGHTGLNRAKLFTDLEVMQEGDRFYLHVMGRVLAYEVDQLKVVEPSNTEDLGIVPGGDYCTLITCTPYGINSHRLLVRGHRVEGTDEQELIRQEEQEQQSRPVDSQWMRQYSKALLIGLLIVVVMVSVSILLERLRKRGRHE